MQFGKSVETNWILRPMAVVACVYLVGLSIWFLWLLLTAQRPETAASDPFRLVGTPQFVALSVVHGALLFALLWDARLARRSPRGLRRGQRAGLFLAAIAVVGGQLATYWSHFPLTN